MLTTLKEYKYTDPNLNDKNMTRWPMAAIWIKSIDALNNDLLAYISQADRKLILKELRENIINRYEKLISGICVGLTAAQGKDISEIPGVLDLVCDHIIQQVHENPKKFIQKYNKKKDLFSFLNEQKTI